MFDQLLALIRRYPRIILHRHTHPDGDALGSQLGMKALLRENFPEKEVYTVGDEAGRYSFMTGSTMDSIPDSLYEGALAILLDVPAADMTSDTRYTLAAATARIDHHLFSGTFTDVEVIDSSFESCAGMVAEFAREQGLRLTPDAAEALFTGMVTDSGRFRYDSVNARSFALAAFLRSQPFDTEKLYRNLYQDSPEMMRKRSVYAGRMQLTAHGVAWIYTDAEQVREMGLTPFSISRGMVNVMADLTGVPIWVNFTESPEGLLAELRSSGININPVAVQFGGGGHKKASGTTLHSREEAMEMLKVLDKLAEEEKTDA